MEDSKVRETVDEAIKCRGGELEAVEIDSCNGDSRFVVWGVVTVEALVLTDIRANPSLCDA